MSNPPLLSKLLDPLPTHEAKLDRGHYVRHGIRRLIELKKAEELIAREAFGKVYKDSAPQNDQALTQQREAMLDELAELAINKKHLAEALENIHAQADNYVIGMTYFAHRIWNDRALRS